MQRSNQAVAQLVAQDEHHHTADKLDHYVPNHKLVDDHDPTVGSFVSLMEH